MQKVFDNAMVAHVWAQQEQDAGRSHNGNFSFDGPVLYSYSTPIARFVESPKGKKAVLVTSRTYSVTTSGKHMPGVHRALGYGGDFNGMPVFYVPEIGERGFYGTYASRPLSDEAHAENLAHLARQYDGVAGKIKWARDVYLTQGGLADVLREHDETAARYAKLFGLKHKARNAAGDAAAVFAARAEREAKANTPAAIAKREAAKLARERKAARAEELKHAEKAEQIAAWRAGEINRAPYGAWDDNRGALLRVRGNVLETSQGASVPLEHAIRVFRFVKLCRETGTAWARNGSTLRVGHFHVDSVDAQGNFRAGCHLINWPEVEAAALAAGVADQAAADTREASR